MVKKKMMTMAMVRMVLMLTMTTCSFVLTLTCWDCAIGDLDEDGC